MVGIPTLHERGYGWLSYEGLGCSYDRHREGYHPMCEGDLNYTCEAYSQSFDLRPRFDHLSRGGRLDVLDPLNEPGGFVSFSWSRR